MLYMLYVEQLTMMKKIIISADKDFLQVIQEGLASKLFNQISKQYREIPEISSIIEKSICGDKFR